MNRRPKQEMSNYEILEDDNLEEHLGDLAFADDFFGSQHQRYEQWKIEWQTQRIRRVQPLHSRMTDNKESRLSRDEKLDSFPVVVWPLLPWELPSGDASGQGHE